MTIGFSQKHLEQLPLDNLTTEQFLCVAIETSRLLGWDFGTISETGFIAYTKNGLFAWNAEVKLKIKNGLANLQSESKGTEIIYIEENKKNLQNFISTFEDLKKSLSLDQLELIYENLKINFV